MEEQCREEGGVATATRQGPAEPAGLAEREGEERRSGWMSMDEKERERRREHTEHNKTKGKDIFDALLHYIQFRFTTRSWH
jgi:hypothetical protein